ncbi:hypothetical protein MUK42_16437 [Musa troglodytarum]|uniref:Uncharacterized protein n=1 Tax=Musa troglodytarum TaxID=320322 RepID=A0A9E7JNH4_9LILI|nr:hypothetical protein MUK42_16437 [Musa troglodytarum]
MKVRPAQDATFDPPPGVRHDNASAQPEAQQDSPFLKAQGGTTRSGPSLGVWINAIRSPDLTTPHGTVLYDTTLCRPTTIWTEIQRGLLAIYQFLGIFSLHSKYSVGHQDISWLAAQILGQNPRNELTMYMEFG